MSSLSTGMARLAPLPVTGKRKHRAGSKRTVRNVKRIEELHAKMLQQGVIKPHSYEYYGKPHWLKKKLDGRSYWLACVNWVDSDIDFMSLSVEDQKEMLAIHPLYTGNPSDILKLVVNDHAQYLGIDLDSIQPTEVVEYMEDVKEINVSSCVSFSQNICRIMRKMNKLMENISDHINELTPEEKKTFIVHADGNLIVLRNGIDNMAKFREKLQ